MADYTSLENAAGKRKSFWSRPEGVTGSIFLLAVLGGLGFLLATNIGAIVGFASSLLGLALTVLALGVIVYMVLDPKMRTLFSYMYKSIMRKITSIFVTIDPIGILKNYVDDLSGNLKKMGKQIGGLRGQMRKIKTMMIDNSKDIENNLKIRKKPKNLIITSN